tara:strand:+ start:652 stop:1965 length:1314 start_codon:yes stop_codon:yes gene_type:complete
MMDVMKGLFASDRPTGATVRRRTPAVRQSSPIGAISGMIEEARGDLSSSIRGLFGQQTPEEAQAQQLQEIKIAYSDALLNTGIDPNTPEGLTAAGNKLINNPNPTIQLVGHNLIKEAQKLEESLAAQRRKVQTEKLNIKEKILKIQKDMKGGTDLAVRFQEAASAKGLPIYETLEEYSEPERKIMADYLQTSAVKVSAAAKESLRQEKAALRQKGKIDAARTTVRALNSVIGRLDSEKTEKPFIPSASVGGLLTWLPGSKFKDLAAQLDTIKANIGFDQLAQLKESSPTGGALGQVSNFELSSLQAVRNSLDQTQSSAQLERNSRLIRDGYGEFLLSIYNDPKLDKTTKREIRFMLGELGFSPNTKSKSSDIILKYSDQDAEKLVTQYQIQMNRIKDALGLEKFNFGVLNKTLKPIDVLTEVERLMVREGRIKPKGN